MSDKVTNIAKNTSFFTIALVLQKVVSFTYFALMARYLDPVDLGRYYTAISFTSIFSIFIELGMANLLMREVPKDQTKAGKLFNVIIAIKIPLSFVALLSVLVFVHFFNYPEITKNLIYLSSISMILDSFTLTAYSTIRGHHNLKFESIGSVIFQLIILTFGISAVRLGYSLRWVVGALVLASIFNFIYSFILINYKWKIKIRPYYNLEFIKKILLITVPFAFFGIFQKIYMYLDTVLLSVLSEEKYVGYYQISFKFIFALQFLPLAFVASLYPAFSRYWKSNKDQLAVTFERSINYLMIISLPIAVGIASLADKIILIFKPEYINAVIPLQIIIVSLFFVFINFPIGSLLNACDKQKQNTINMGVVLFASILMNIFLIPRFNAIGASITVVTTNILMSFLGMFFVFKILDNYKFKKNLSVFFKAILSVMVMSLVVLKLKIYLNIILVILLGGITYFLMIFATRAIKLSDIKSISQSFLKNKS